MTLLLELSIAPQLYKVADAKEEAIKRADRGDYKGGRQVSTGFYFLQ